jgi:hypothetical protein
MYNQEHGWHQKTIIAKEWQNKKIGKLFTLATEKEYGPGDFFKIVVLYMCVEQVDSQTT